MRLDFESHLQQVIFPDLKKGRPNWDLPHTKGVVHWIKQILTETNLDHKVLITAAYAHDWGYIGLFPDGASYAQIAKMKPLHMKRGAEKIEKLLKSDLADEFTHKQIQRVTHLVAIHDQLTKIKDEDEVLLVEADTLGALDNTFVKPTFSKKDNQRYIREVEQNRFPLFTHPRAINAFHRLKQSRLDYYQQSSL